MYNKNNNNPNTSRFHNIKNFFSIKNLLILFCTLFISFFFRLVIIKLFALDITLFTDFIFVSSLVSFIRPLVTDFFNIIQYEVIILQELYLPGNVYALYKKDLRSNGGKTNHTSNSFNDAGPNYNIGHLIKQRIF